MFVALAIVIKMHQYARVMHESRVQPPVNRSEERERKSRNRRPVDNSVHTSTRHSQETVIDGQPRVQSRATKRQKKPRKGRSNFTTVRTAKRHPQEHDE